jgi:hypothetical protein
VRPPSSSPQQQYRAGADEQVVDDVLVGQHDLQRRIQVDQVEADKARGGQGAFKNLDVEKK